MAEGSSRLPREERLSATRDDLPTTYHQDTWAFRSPHSWRYEFADNPSPALERRALLDKPTPRHPLLDALMDHALSRILLTADGATMQLKVRIRGTATRGAAPVSSLAGDIDQLADDYTAAKTHRARLIVIKRAQDFYMRIAYSRKADPALVRGTLEWRERIARDSRPQRVVTHFYGVSSKTVTAARKEFGITG